MIIIREPWIGAIQLRGAPRILFTAVPPLQRFPALPQPTRSVLGVRSRLLDGVLQGVLSEIAGVDYLAIRFPVQRDYMASDGFHPSALGYDEWAAQIAARINDDL